MTMHDTLYDTTKTPETHPYDLANWKPIQVARYIEALAICSQTFDEPSSLTVTCENLDDGRVRLVTLAMASDPNAGPVTLQSPVPYLMQLSEPEKKDHYFFIRTDLDLVFA